MDVGRRMKTPSIPGSAILATPALCLPNPKSSILEKIPCPLVFIALSPSRCGRAAHSRTACGDLDIYSDKSLASSHYPTRCDFSERTAVRHGTCLKCSPLAGPSAIEHKLLTVRRNETSSCSDPPSGSAMMKPVDQTDARITVPAGDD